MVLYGWASLIVISLWVSLVAFVWALKSGQFSDQGRARYLPLVDEAPLPPVLNPARARRELTVLIVIGIIGLVVVLIPVGMVLLRVTG
jgi:cbb3-type cytochrome oxidase maturation protein